jgi:hypothetical protein
MTIYTWGYGHEVWEMLQGVKAFVANDAYMSAIAIAIMLFMLMIRFLNTGQVDWKMFLVSLIAVSVFLKPSTTTFNIVDEATGYGSTVSNIPIGLGVLLAFESQLEKAILQKTENSFSTPTGVQLQKAGMGFSFIAPLEMMHANPTDHYLQLTFTHWMNNCFLYDIAKGNTNLNTVVNSTDIIANLAPTVRFETLVFSTTNPQGIEQDCQTAYNTIKTKLGTEANTYLTSVLPTKLNMAGSANFSGALTDTQTLIHQASTNSAKWVEQEMMRNMLDKGFKATATMTGGELASTAWSAAVAKAATNQTWRMTGEQAKNNLPVVRAIGTSLLIGVSVIVAFFAIASMNFKALFMVFAGFITLGLWSPIAALINYQVYRRAEDALSTGFGTLANSDAGLEQIATYAANLEWWYGAIPMISYMLITGGGMGAMYLLRDAGAGSGAGASAGLDASRGNISHGNTNVDNSTMSEKRANHEGFVDDLGVHNNLDTHGTTTTSNSGTDGVGGRYNGSYMSGDDGSTQTSVSNGAGSLTMSSDSGGNIVSSSFDSSIRASSIASMSQASLTETQKEADSQQESLAHQLSNNFQSAYSEGKNLADADVVQDTFGLSESDAHTISNIEQESQMKAMAETMSNKESADLSTKLGNKYSIGGQAGAGIDFGKMFGENSPIKLSLDAQGGVEGYRVVDGTGKEIFSKDFSNSEQSSFNQSLSDARTESLKEDVGIVQNLSKSISEGSSSFNQVSKSDANNYVNTLSHMEGLESQASLMQSQLITQKNELDGMAIKNFIESDPKLSKMHHSGIPSQMQNAESTAMNQMYDGARIDSPYYDKTKEAYAKASAQLSNNDVLNQAHSRINSYNSSENSISQGYSDINQQYTPTVNTDRARTDNANYRGDRESSIKDNSTVSNSNIGLGSDNKYDIARNNMKTIEATAYQGVTTYNPDSPDVFGNGYHTVAGQETGNSYTRSKAWDKAEDSGLINATTTGGAFLPSSNFDEVVQNFSTKELKQIIDAQQDHAIGWNLSNSATEKITDEISARTLSEQQAGNTVNPNDIKMKDLSSFSQKKNELNNNYTGNWEDINKNKINPITHKQGGDASWRNNNPGNLMAMFEGRVNPVNGNVTHSKRTHEEALKAMQSKYEGVQEIDRYGSLVFDTKEHGDAAQRQLINSWRNKSISSAIHAYAPPTDANNTKAYVQSVASAIGVSPDTKIGDLNSVQKEKLFDSIKKVEGQKEGTYLS